jgi:L-ascorbate metabolism protein UlaG (beta-lactamase superfamily)
MELIWYGHACFRLKERAVTIVTDPYDKSLGLSPPRLKADIVTISHPGPHHGHTVGIHGDFKVIDGPGEYEIGGLFITGVDLPPLKKRSQDELTAPNNIFIFYLDDLTLCHLGDLRHVPSQSQVEDLGNIDVLMIPVGGGKNALNAAQAAEVISLIEPYLVIPMHYGLPNLTVPLDPVEKFLKEMGITKAETQESLKLTKSSLPQETQVLLMAAKI